jgi:hypothetical protein
MNTKCAICILPSTTLNNFHSNVDLRAGGQEQSGTIRRNDLAAPV